MSENPIWGRGLQGDGWSAGYTARLAGRRLPAPIRASEFTIETGPLLLDGWIGVGDLAAIVGATGCGKSTLAASLACSIAHGIPFAGLACRKARVLYLAGEGSQGFQRRVLAWHLHHRLDLQDADLSMIPAALALDGGSGHEHLAELVAIGFDVLFLDTWARSLGGTDENDAGFVGEAIAAIDELRAANGATAILLHHTGKDPERGARGSSAFKAALDVEITIERDVSGNGSIRSTKQRDREFAAPIGFRLAGVTIRAEDTVIISAPVAAFDRAAPAAAKPRLSSSERRARTFLADLIAAEGTPLPAAAGFPDPINGCRLQGIPATRWRQECDARRLCASDEKRVRSNAFRRAFSSLLEANAIAARDDLVWLAS